MAISTDALIQFFGTQDSVDDGSTSAISNDNFSVAADISTWTNDDDAVSAIMILQCQFATAPTDHSVINIYGRKLAVESTNDTSIPDANNLDQWVGSFTVDGTIATATDAWLVAEVFLPNTKTSQTYDFYLQNLTGQTISANWECWITPTALGPHA